MEMKPIGYMQSVFKYKNGTPRQPMLCENARGILRIEKSIFNNPEHSLEDLDKFSHVWILFIFHKNSSSVSKAKVKPPRLDGRRVGVFSTRSPHRPNPIGLTLARLDKVEGCCIYLSGIDILDGTPILDVKPYIHEYDTPTWSPQSPNIPCTNPSNIDNSAFEKPEDLAAKSAEAVLSTESQMGRQERNGRTEGEETSSSDFRPNDGSHQPLAASHTPSTNKQDLSELTDSLRHGMCVKNKTGVCVKEEMCENRGHNNERLIGLRSTSDTHSCWTSNVLSTEDLSAKKEVQLKNTDCSEELKISRHDRAAAAANISSSWIPEINIKLHVRFTERAESQLKLFSKDSFKPEYRLRLLDDFSQLRRSIISILSEDPRSVYRRHKCLDSLYYFTVDQAHLTCWFDGNTAEIVRVQSIDLVKELLPQD